MDTVESLKADMARQKERYAKLMEEEDEDYKKRLFNMELEVNEVCADERDEALEKLRNEFEKRKREAVMDLQRAAKGEILAMKIDYQIMIKEQDRLLADLEKKIEFKQKFCNPDRLKRRLADLQQKNKDLQEAICQAEEKLNSRKTISDEERSERFELQMAVNNQIREINNLKDKKERLLKNKDNAFLCRQCANVVNMNSQNLLDMKQHYEELLQMKEVEGNKQLEEQLQHLTKMADEFRKKYDTPEQRQLVADLMREAQESSENVEEAKKFYANETQKLDDIIANNRKILEAKKELLQQLDYEYKQYKMDLFKPDKKKRNNTFSRCSDDLRSYYNVSFMKCSCSKSRNYEKVIFYIEDGIRSDLLYGNRYKDNDSYKPVFNEYLNKYPNNTFCVDVYANTPTTTYEGVKSMTTGSISHFLELASSFGDIKGSVIDNWVSQASLHNYSIDFVGDDVWYTLYNTSYSNIMITDDSFNIHEYDEQPMYDFLYDHIHNKNNKNNNISDNNISDNNQSNSHSLSTDSHDYQWDILILHMLSLDHAGHKYSTSNPSHPEVHKGLVHLKHALQDTINTLPKDSILLVMGDHGLTERGSHGGGEEDERKTGLCVYTNKKNSLRKEGPSEYKMKDIANMMSSLLSLPPLYSSISIPILQLLSPSSSLLPPLLRQLASEQRFLKEQGIFDSKRNNEILSIKQQLEQYKYNISLYYHNLEQSYSISTNSSISFDNYILQTPENPLEKEKEFQIYQQGVLLLTDIDHYVSNSQHYDILLLFLSILLFIKYILLYIWYVFEHENPLLSPYCYTSYEIKLELFSSFFLGIYIGSLLQLLFAIPYRYSILFSLFIYNIDKYYYLLKALFTMLFTLPLSFDIPIIIVGIALFICIHAAYYTMLSPLPVILLASLTALILYIYKDILIYKKVSVPCLLFILSTLAYSYVPFQSQEVPIYDSHYFYCYLLLLLFYPLLSFIYIYLYIQKPFSFISFSLLGLQYSILYCYWYYKYMNLSINLSSIPITLLLFTLLSLLYIYITHNYLSISYSTRTISLHTSTVSIQSIQSPSSSLQKEYSSFNSLLYSFPYYIHSILSIIPLFLLILGPSSPFLLLLLITQLTTVTLLTIQVNSLPLLYRYTIPYLLFIILYLNIYINLNSLSLSSLHIDASFLFMHKLNMFVQGISILPSVCYDYIDVNVVKDSYYKAGYEHGKTVASLAHKRYTSDYNLNNIIIPWYTTSKGQELFKQILNRHIDRFPEYIEELHGISDGMDIPFEYVFLYTLSEEFSYLADNHDYKRIDHCSDFTIYIHIDILVHNEDGAIEDAGNTLVLTQKIFINNTIVSDFTSYTYVGVLPTASFGKNKNIAFTMNYLHSDDYDINGYSRNFIARYLLDSQSFEDALERITSTPHFVGHNYQIMNIKHKEAVDLEIAPFKRRGYFYPSPGHPHFHANMFDLIHVQDTYDASSFYREKRAAQMMPAKTFEDALLILGDNSDPFFPIYQRGGNSTLHTIHTVKIATNDPYMTIYKSIGQSKKSKSKEIQLVTPDQLSSSKKNKPLNNEKNVQKNESIRNVVDSIKNIFSNDNTTKPLENIQDENLFAKDMDKIKNLKAKIDSIALATIDIRHLLSELADVQNPKHQEDIIRNVREIITKTNDTAAHCRFDLQGMTLEVNRLKREKKEGTIMNLYLHNNASLSHLFINNVRDYQEIQQNFQRLLERDIESEMTVLREYTQQDMDAESMSNPLILQTIAKSTNHRIREAFINVQDKYRDIVSIKNSMKDIQQLFFDLSLLLDEQGTQLDQVEVNINQAGDHVKQAEATLELTVIRMRKKRKIRCILLVVIIVCAIVLSVLVYFAFKK
ncbi:hypothetical protein WA158_008393 [Blastocystis sp. Blastoise]